MEKVTWGRAFGFSATAIGVPYAIVAAAAGILVAVSQRPTPVAATLVASPLIVVAAIAVGGLLARRWPPQWRFSAALQSAAASAGGTALVVIVAGLVTWSAGAHTLIAAVLAVGTFAIAGGAMWAAAGGIAASRILGFPLPRVSRVLVVGPVVAGLVAAGACLALAVTSSPVCALGSVPSWSWMPFGWACDAGSGARAVSWGPTFGVSNGLACSAIGLALLVRTRRVRVERERFLFA